MSIFEFSGRQFLLKAEKISKAEKQIYELITANKSLISYPYEVETSNGEHITAWRPLSDEDVRILLNEKDNRPLADRLNWEGASDFFIREYGVPATVKRIAPVAHLPFLCSIVDEHMTTSTYGMPLSVEDYVYLVRWVMDNPCYDIKGLQKTRPALYERITNEERLPRALQETSIILLTSAEQTVCKLGDFEPDGDEVYAMEHEDGSMSHICAQVSGDNTIVLSAETATKDDIESHGLLVITDAETFMRRTGAYTTESLLRTIGTMYHGLDVDLRHIANYCDRERIEYIIKKD